MYKLAFLFFVFFNPTVASLAADISPAPVAAVENKELKKARESIVKKDWPAAIVVLEPYTKNTANDADGFNLLGYSYRNIKRYDESLVAYKRALEIDPKHRGAHEYIGMAYIQMSQLANAKIHLDALDKICTFSCEEYRDLKKAYLAATSTTK
jgi:tetratricopeptide (TPR) repeat protein